MGVCWLQFRYGIGRIPEGSRSICAYLVAGIWAFLVGDYG